MNTTLKSFLLKKNILKFLMVSFFLILSSQSLLAQGNLLVYPTRVVFDGKNNIQKVVLSNTGKDSALYDISFIEYKMTKFGEMKLISAPEEGLNFASPNLRYFPRRVVLGPFQSQTLKIQLRNARSLKDGEYRSHLYFRAVQEKKALGSVDEKNATDISVKLKPIFGISIPCIIKKGEDNTKVTLSELSLNQENTNQFFLNLNINRTGNMSVYGDFMIHYLDQKNKLHQVGRVQGVGVYTPGNVRTIRVKLTAPKNSTFSGGKLQVVFTKNESKEILAEANLVL